MTTPNEFKVRHAKTRRQRRTRAVAMLAATSLIVAGAVTSTQAQAQPKRAWLNAALSPDARAAAILDQMTLAEKVELMTGNQGDAPTAYYNAPIPRLGIPSLRMADAGAGIANRDWTLPATGKAATAMPSGEALAATFSPGLARRYAGVVTDEAKQTGHNMLLGPNADIVRTPWWGRIAETESEDTHLTTTITTPYVAEVQKRNVIADLKHYVAYNQEVNRGNAQNTIIGERALREVYIPPYADAISKAGLGSIMCSFNKINGTFSCENSDTLDKILRKDLGFSGFVITDFGAIHSTVPSIEAGTDLETGTNSFYDGALLAAVTGGQVPVSLVDRSVLRILRTMFAVGLFDHSYAPSAIPVQSHGAVARSVQDRAITLLKNTKRTLPLKKSTRSIVVIGGDANVASSAGGASHVTPTYQVPIVKGLRDRAARVGAKVRFTSGNDPVNGANMLESSRRTAVPSSVLAPASGGGTGLTAQYWGNTTFTGDPGATRVDRQVNYDTGFIGGQPAFTSLYASQVPATPALSNPLGAAQSARYTGTITAPKSGTYKLSLTGWGDATLTLDGNVVIDMTGRDGRRTVDSAAISFVRGQSHTIRIDYAATHALNSLEPGTLLLQWATPSGAYSPAIQRAARAARAADVAVVYVRTYESEQRDRVSLKLPQSADQLITAVRAANPKTVVVLASGGPVTMPWLGKTPAVLQNYYGGQEEGNALARVVYGDVNPSGRLPITYPRSETAVPRDVANPWAGVANPNVTYAEGIDVGYKGYLRNRITPLFPFGYGLSYTSFGYSKLRVSGANDTGTVQPTVSLRVKNTGRSRGTEVVQVYVGALGTRATTPVRALAGYAKVNLGKGKSATVTVKLDRRALSYYNTTTQKWVTPKGNVRLYVGRSATKATLVGTLRVR